MRANPWLSAAALALALGDQDRSADLDAQAELIGAVIGARLRRLFCSDHRGGTKGQGWAERAASLRYLRQVGCVPSRSLLVLVLSGVYFIGNDAE